MKVRVLIIDDDRRLCELLVEYLARFGMDAVYRTEPEAGLSYLHDTDRAPGSTSTDELPADLVVLDVMLPGMDGFEVCRRIRSFSRIPIVMLTARGEITDRVVGLELGADDYLPKPFEPRELVARIEAVLRRSAGAPGRHADTADSPLRVGALLVDKKRREAKIDDRPLGLSTLEFDLLALLIEQPGRVFDRDQIMERLKGAHWGAFDRSVDVLVSRLRKKLDGGDRMRRIVQTVRGVGYRLVPEDTVE